MDKGPEQTFLQGGHTEGPETYEGCSASLAIREMHIKTTMKDHFTPVRMAIINKQVLTRLWREGRTLVYCWWECRLVQPLWKAVWNFLKILKLEVPFDPVTPMLGLYLKNPKIPKEPMHPNVHTCVIYNSQVLETA